MTRRDSWDLLRLALAAALLTSVWRIQDLFPALAPLRLPILMILVLLVLLAISPREQLRLVLASQSNVLRALALIVALAVLSVPTSLWMGHSFSYLLKHVLPAFVLAIAAAVASYTVSDARRVAAIQVIGAVMFAVVILLRFEVGEGGRLGDLVHYDANDLGLLIVCALPLAVYFLEYAPRIAWRVLALGCIGVFLATIVRTGSRGAFLGLLAVTLFLLLRYSTVYWGRRVAILVGVAALFIASTGAQYRTSLATLLEPTSDYNWTGNTEGGRMAIWERGLFYMKSRPLTGVGLNAFPIAEGTLSPLADRQMFARGVKWSAPHSVYVQIGAELGILALLVFVGMLVGAVVMAGRLAGEATRRGERSIAALARAQSAGIVGFAIAGAFLSQAYSTFLFVSLGAMVGLDLAARQAWRAARLA